MTYPVPDLLKQACIYRTERVSILHWSYIESKAEYSNKRTQIVSEIMTPNVTKALPDDWQNLNSQIKVDKWIEEQKKESYFYAITLSDTEDIIGFMFLYPENERDKSFDLRLGYLLSESSWGKGLGSELIKGLVEWCRDSGAIKSISGGVEKDNIGSIKVLEKNGFYQSDETLGLNMLLYRVDL